MKTVTTVITDLDDTLWDWVDIWYKSFSAMLARLEEDSQVPRTQLLAEFKQVFAKHRTTEYAFAIEELPSLRSKHPNGDLAHEYSSAIRAYRKARGKAVRAYPTVTDTIRRLKSEGVLLVGYTESMSFYTRYRLRKLGYDDLFDFIYSPEDHALPANHTTQSLRYYAPEAYLLRSTIHRFTPSEHIKPSPQLLLDIIADLGAKPEEVIYVGDKLHKDISMAKDAGITDVWAAYGEAKDRAEYDLLRQVTHWSEEQVANERETTPEKLRPTYVLRHCFGEVLELFQFGPFNPADRQMDHVIELWKKAIDVQMHFNDIELRIRNYAITLLVAVFAASGVALDKNWFVSLWSARIPSASLILIVGIIATGLFYSMEEFWYHRFLVGAVRHAERIEFRLRNALPELGLTYSISRASPVHLRGFTFHSKHKLRLFYGIIGLILAAAFVLTMFVAAPTRSW